MPTPYYAGPRATLYLGDCREVLAALPKLDAGLLAVDPPYGVRWQSGWRQDRFNLMDGDDASVDWPQVLGEIARRHLPHRRHVYVFGYRPDQLVDPLQLGGAVELIWDKGQAGMGNLNSTWGPQHERITFGVFTPSAAERRGGRGALAARLRRGSVLRHPAIRNRTVRHPDEKPVPLMRELIESSTMAGDLVIDPCAGVGSTLVAAVLEGRRGIGVERDEGYADIAAERLRLAEKLASELDAA